MHALEMQIKRTYERRNALLNELRDCLETERKSLMDVDVEQLWELMDKKNALAKDVERTGNEIRGLLEEGFPGSEESSQSSALRRRRWYKELHVEENLLKEEVRARLEENQMFMRDSLGFLDELMHIIVQSGEKGKDYQHLLKPRKSNAAGIYHREV